MSTWVVEAYRGSYDAVTTPFEIVADRFEIDHGAGIGFPLVRFFRGKDVEPFMLVAGFYTMQKKEKELHEEV